MKNSRAFFHLCASPNAPAGDGDGSSCTSSSCTCSAEPAVKTAARNLFSPFSPMDSQNQENTTSNTTTPRRKLSLEMDENAQSPSTTEQDIGYGGSLGSSSASSLDENTEANSTANQSSSRTPLGEIKLSSLNAVDSHGCQRKTLLARRLMKRKNSESRNKENVSGKDSPLGEVLKFPHPSSLLFHRPTSLATLPLSPLTQQYQSSSSSGEGGPLSKSLQSGACKNLIKQISSPLERMSLDSPRSGSGVRAPSLLQRSSSVASSTYTDGFSDGYFSEVFEGEEMDDINSSLTPLSDTLTTLINAPFANSPSPSTTTSKPTFHVGGMKGKHVGPTSPHFPPLHAPSFFRSESWCSPSSSASSRAVGEEKSSQQKRGSLKRPSPCNEIAKMHRTKRRPPLPFSDFSSNSQDSPPATAVKPLKGTPLLRSQSCCMPPKEPLLSPTSPGGDDLNTIGDFSKPYALPLVPGSGSVRDLKCISPQTMSQLLAGHYNGVITSFKVIDCRFPYEYEGGHIANAINIWEKDQLIKYFFDDPQHSPEQHRNVYIFHCEFSSQRGPKMSRFLRETDRRKNGMDFPKLYYPELYLLEGGYKAFFKDHQDLCEPRGYREMRDENHRAELRHCKLRSKSLNSDCHPRRRQPLLRNRKSAFITNENDNSNTSVSESTYSRTISTPSQLGAHN